MVQTSAAWIGSGVSAVRQIPSRHGSSRGLRPSLATLLDLMGEPVALLAANGDLLHQNRALEDLLSDSTDRTLLTARLAEVARESKIDSRQLHQSTAQTPGQRFTLDVHRLEMDLLWPAGTVLIRIIPIHSQILDAGQLAIAFGLTRRQAEVAVLLAQGYRNRELALVLAISPHTARRHTEQVLARLGVSTRAKAACLLGAPRVYSA
jgi:DNA-binding CsgD family transcriptional regulator